MQLTIRSGDPAAEACDALLVPVAADTRLSGPAAAVNAAANGALAAVLALGDFEWEQAGVTPPPTRFRPAWALARRCGVRRACQVLYRPGRGNDESDPASYPNSFRGRSLTAPIRSSLARSLRGGAMVAIMGL